LKDERSFVRDGKENKTVAKTKKQKQNKNKNKIPHSHTALALPTSRAI
jgi:hypothetical protein